MSTHTSDQSLSVEYKKVDNSLRESIDVDEFDLYPNQITDEYDIDYKCIQNGKDLNIMASDMIDNALKTHYEELGYKHWITDHNGYGNFKKYVIEQKLDDNILIEQELGDNGNPTQCLFSVFYQDQFPFPSYFHFTNQDQKEQYVFYIMQYCYKYGISPTKQCMSYLNFTLFLYCLLFIDLLI